MDRTADGYPQLVAIDHSGKFPMLPLPVGSKTEKISVLGEHDSAKLPSPLQKTVILPVGSSVLLVRLSVDAGRIVAANGPGVVVVGTPAARTFTGTPAAMTASFAALGRIRYAPAANDFGDRTLRIEASDRVAATEIVRRIRVTPVNDALTIAAFTIRAWDGQAASVVQSRVTVNLA